MTTAPKHTAVTIRARHAVSTRFKGRGQIVEKLSAFFIPRGDGKYPRREFLLHGMGGAGKSQIALKFAEDYEERCVQSPSAH